MNPRHALLLVLPLLLCGARTVAAQPLHAELATPPELEALTLGAHPAWSSDGGLLRYLPELRLEGAGGLGDASPDKAGALAAQLRAGWRVSPLLLAAASTEVELAALEGSPLTGVASPEHGLRGQHHLELLLTPLRAPSPDLGLPAISALLQLDVSHAGARRPWVRPIRLGPAPYLDAQSRLELHLGREWGAVLEVRADAFSHSLGRGWLSPTTVVGAAIAPGVWGDSLQGRSFGNTVQALRVGVLQADRRASPLGEQPADWTSRLLDLRLFDLKMRSSGDDDALPHGLGTVVTRVESSLGVVTGLDDEGWGLTGRMAGALWYALASLGGGVSRTPELSTDGSQWLLVRRIEVFGGIGGFGEANARLTLLGDQLQGMDRNLPQDPLRFGAQLQGNLPLGAGFSLGADLRAAHDTAQRSWTPTTGAGWNLQGSLLLRWAPATDTLSTQTELPL